jgi:hypothetical protein
MVYTYPESFCVRNSPKYPPFRKEAAMSTQPGVFVGILTGQNEAHSPTITLRAGTPPPASPGTVGSQPTLGPQTNTITVDGEKAQIQVGGATQTGSISVLNPANRTIVTLSGSADALRMFRALGALTIHFSADPDGVLELFNGEGKKTIALNPNGGPDGLLHLLNGQGARTVALSSKGGSGWFGGSGVDGDLLVFSADATGSDAAQAAVWIKGSTGDVVLKNADCAEDFEVQEDAEVEPGTVLSLGDNGALAVSAIAYDRRVAGIISGACGLRPGIVLGRTTGAGNRWPIALSGKVFCKVDADQSPISPGDLMTTAALPGHAMAVRDHTRAFGAVLGKALAPLASGRGLLPILVALQ